MASMDDFFQPGDNCSVSYKNVRDLEHLFHHKRRVEKLWRLYQQHADVNFLSDARHHFQERFWEMYIGCALMINGFKISSEGSTGPEFCIWLQNKRCWFEAIAPSAGTGPDAVPEMQYNTNVATPVPEDEIVLRLRHAIREKYKKYWRYREIGIVKQDEPYVIGINSKRIRTIVSDPDIPLIVKAVFPFGYPIAVFGKGGSGIVDSYHSYREHIEKKSGEKVTTNIFEDSEYSGISAVLYSGVDCCNYPKSMGADFRLVHNPMADSPLTMGTLTFGVECWVEGSDLVRKDWNSDSADFEK